MKYLASFVHVGMSAYERFHLITEPQNDWDWKGPLEIIYSKCPAKAGASRAGCPGEIKERLEMQGLLSMENKRM